MEIIFITLATLIVAILTLLSSIGKLRFKVPIDSNFLLNHKLKKEIDVSTGDPAKRITLRFKNKSNTTLTGIEIDIRFMRPLSLSGGESAVTIIPNQTTRGKSVGNDSYHIHYSKLIFPGLSKIDLNYELNTKGLKLGRHIIAILIYTTQKRYNDKRELLIINAK